MWDLQSNKMVKTFSGHQWQIWSIALSPDGKILASASKDKTVKLWNVQSGKLIKTLKAHRDEVFSVAFSPDGNFILSGSRDHTMKLWNVKTGKLKKTFGKPYNKYKVSAKSRFEHVNSVAFSSDGNFLASGTTDANVKLWNKNSGKLIKTFKGHISAVRSVSFLKHKNQVISSAKTIKLWDINTGKTVKTFRGYAAYLSKAAVSKNGEYALVSYSMNVANPEKDKPESYSYISGKYKIYLVLWDLKSLTKIWKIESKQKGISSIVITPNLKNAVISAWDKTIKILDLKTGKEIRTINAHKDKVTTMKLSPDGKMILSGSKDKTVKLWDLKTGNLIKKYNINKDILSLAFSPDGKQFLYGSWFKPIQLININNGKVLKTYHLPSGRKFYPYYFSLAFSPVNNLFLAGTGYNYFQIWDLDSGKELMKKSDIASYDMNFSADGKLVVMASRGDFIKVWDINQRKVIATLKTNLNGVFNPIFLNDGRTIAFGAGDGTIRKWNYKTGEWVAFSNSITDDGWIIFTHDGYWDASVNGGELVAMVNKMNSWNIDQFAVKNNRPDIILKRLISNNYELINHYYNQYKKRLRKLGLNEDDISDEIHVPKTKILVSNKNGKFIKLNFILSDSKYLLSRYNIYVNDVPVFGAYGKNISKNDKKSITISETIELTSGKNKIEVSCMNEKGTESFRALTYATYDKKVKGNLYFLGFGISKFKNKNLNLKYAHQDVKDLAKLFKKMNNNFNKVLIKTYINKQVSVKNIINSKKFLKNAKVDDTFILFIAGHGIHDQDNEATYYYLTYKADLKNLKKTSANFDLIENLLQGIAPRNKLFLMDTCESGEVEDKVQNKYFTYAKNKKNIARTTRGLKVISKKRKITKKRKYLFNKNRFIYNDLLRRSGAIVFSSSKGGEFSYENDKVKNGFFTEQIINALTKKSADINRDKKITIDELKKYVTKSVAKMSGNLQHPTVDRDNIFQKFSLPLAK